MNEENESVAITIARLLGTVYGPYAFGLVSILVLWLALVSPQLEAQRVDWQSNKELIQKLNELNRNQLVVGQTMESTARVLERAVEKLETIKIGN